MQNGQVKIFFSGLIVVVLKKKRNGKLVDLEGGA